MFYRRICVAAAAVQRGALGVGGRWPGGCGREGERGDDRSAPRCLPRRECAQLRAVWAAQLRSSVAGQVLASPSSVSQLRIEMHASASSARQDHGVPRRHPLAGVATNPNAAGGVGSGAGAKVGGSVPPALAPALVLRRLRPPRLRRCATSSALRSSHASHLPLFSLPVSLSPVLVQIRMCMAASSLRWKTIAVHARSVQSD